MRKQNELNDPKNKLEWQNVSVKFTKALGFVFTFLILLFASCESETEVVQEEQQILEEIDLDDGAITKNFVPIEGQYIVELKKGSLTGFKTASTFRSLSKPDQKQAYFSEIDQIRNQINRSSDLTFEFDKKAILNVYSFALEGFSVKLTDEEYNRLKNHPKVESIYQDYKISISSMASAASYYMFAQDTPWGISRVGGA